MTSGKQAILSRIEETAAKTAGAREKKKSKGSAESFVAVWNDTVNDTFGKEHIVAPLISTMGKLRRALDRLHVSTVQKTAFLTSTVQSWEIITPTLFKGGNPPAVPSLPWFVANIDRYYAAYLNPKKSMARDLDGEIAELKIKVDEQAREIIRLGKELAEANKKLDQRARRKDW